MCVYVDGSSFRTSSLTSESHRELLPLARLHQHGRLAQPDHHHAVASLNLTPIALRT